MISSEQATRLDEVITIDYEKRSRSDLIAHLRQQLAEEGFLNLLFFGLIVSATRLRLAHPELTMALGLVLACLVGCKLLAKRRDANEALLALLAGLTGLFFGGLASLSLSQFSISWTSFFTVLVSLTTCVTSLSTFVYSRSCLRSHLITFFGVLLPTSALSFHGTEAVALPVFFLGIGLLLWFHAHNQESLLQEKTRNEARMQAMLDALPGTLSWVSKDGVYQGVNRQLASLWQSEPRDFVGERVGFRDPSSPIVAFSNRLFERPETQRTLVESITIDGGSRQYVIIGRKYNHDEEAIILGFDLETLGDARKVS